VAEVSELGRPLRRGGRCGKDAFCRADVFGPRTPTALMPTLSADQRSPHLKHLRSSDTFDANVCMGGAFWRLARALLTVNVMTQALPHVQAG